MLSSNQPVEECIFFMSAHQRQPWLGSLWFWLPLCPFLEKIFQICPKHQFGSKDELNRFWYSKVKGCCDLIKRIFDHNLRTHSLIVTKFHTNVQQDVMKQWWHFISKRSKVIFTVTSYCSGHYSTTYIRNRGWDCDHNSHLLTYWINDWS